jgi:PEP-CTERM motif
VIVAADEGSIAKLNRIEETFTYMAIPEPGSFLLAGAGFGLLFLLRRRKQGLLMIIGLAVLAAMISPAAHASPINCLSITESHGSHATLQDFMNQGACSVGDVTFGFGPSSFTETGSATRIPSASTITVNVQGMGFQFTFLAIVNGGQSETFGITYTATAATGKVAGFSSGDTVSYNGTHSYSGSSIQLKDGATTLSTVAFPAGGVGSAFAPVLPGTTLTIVDTMHLSATGAGSYAHISNLTNDLTMTPEPLTSVLCGAGLLVIGLAFRSRKPKD